MADEQLIVGDKYDLYKIRFVNNKNTFQVYVTHGALWVLVKLTTPLVYIPFGVEKYNFKDIVNIELKDLESSNEMYNFHATVKTIDNFMMRLSFDQELQNKVGLSQNIRNMIKGKTYFSNIRPKHGKFDPLMRLHLKKKGKNTITNVFKNEQLIPVTALKGNNCLCRLEIGSLWATGTNYGINWIVDTINVC